MSRRLVRWLPAALVPVSVLWVADSRGVFPSPATAAVTIVIGAVLLAVELRRGVRVTVPAAWLAALVVWAAMAAAFRPVERGEAARFVAAGALAVVLALLVARPRAAAWGRLGVALAGATAAAWLVAERLAAPGRPGGPLENPNIAATVMALAFALVPRLRWRPAARVAAAALLVAGIVVSGSRAGMLAAIVVGATWMLAATGRVVRGAVVTVIVIAAAGLAARVLTDRDPLRFERVRIWVVAWRTAVAELPFGAGPAGYTDAAIAHNFPRGGELARYHRLPTLAESDPLELLAALGVPGALLGIGLILGVKRQAAVCRTAWPPLAALAVTSAVHTQLPLPAVAWTATLAVAASLPRARAWRVRAPRAVALAGAAVAAPVLAAALAATPGSRVTADRLVAVGERALARTGLDDAALADAEAATWLGCMRRPRWAGAWSVLGSIRLTRALQRGEGMLAAAAVDAFAAARSANPLDVWAALGEGRAHRALGETAAAAGALEAAVRLEPSCAPAWIELALLRFDEGQLGAARQALARVEAVAAAARGLSLDSRYERALVQVDRATLARLRERCGVSR
jgi:hypothetical protein